MKNSKIYRIVTQVICVIALIIFMLPLVLMLQKSFSVGGLENYKTVIENFNMLPNFCMSILVVGGTLLIVMTVTSMAAFAFSKLEFPFKKVIYYILLTGMMIPTSVLIFPLYRIVRGLGLNNTPLALIFPYATLNACFNLMVLKNYYDGLPNELIEAARIDGANKMKTFVSIMLPIAKPGLVFVLMQTFLSAWNELQMALVFINDTSRQPLSVVPLRFIQTGAVGYPIYVTYASLVICLSPIAIFYVFASRQLVEGLTTGAVKG